MVSCELVLHLIIHVVVVDVVPDVYSLKSESDGIIFVVVEDLVIVAILEFLCPLKKNQEKILLKSYFQVLCIRAIT